MAFKNLNIRGFARPRLASTNRLKGQANLSTACLMSIKVSGETPDGTSADTVDQCDDSILDNFELATFTIGYTSRQAETL